MISRANSYNCGTLEAQPWFRSGWYVTRPFNLRPALMGFLQVSQNMHIYIWLVDPGGMFYQLLPLSSVCQLCISLKPCFFLFFCFFWRRYIDAASARTPNPRGRSWTRFDATLVVGPAKTFRTWWRLELGIIVYFGVCPSGKKVGIKAGYGWENWTINSPSCEIPIDACDHQLLDIHVSMLAKLCRRHL